jgi:enoyl-CoA hydratase/carnithine racemase
VADVGRVSGYQTLRVRADRVVAWLTIDHPPSNLFDAPLMGDLMRAGAALEADPDVRVVVIDSANPEFFIAHADVKLIQLLPAEAPQKPTELGFFHAMVDRFRTMPKATIGVVEGIARGGGSELLLFLDMRFGALGRAVLAQPEVALGIIPGGSGTQRLPRLVRRARALEIIVGCNDFPADLAERYGWLNRALPPAELRPFVERLAQQIASFPPRPSPWRRGRRRGRAANPGRAPRGGRLLQSRRRHSRGSRPHGALFSRSVVRPRRWSAIRRGSRRVSSTSRNRRGILVFAMVENPANA